MTLQDRYQYLPRKRRNISLDFTAAGIPGTLSRTDDHRYHFNIKRRGKEPTLTVRSRV